MSDSRIDAKAVTGLLAAKHSKDVFVSECKDGPTQLVNHLRLDGWAMRKSWSNPTTFGYEIKVSRSDFLNDRKWVDYLGLCNEFYFVCPTGLIEKDELPEQAGLLWVAKTGSRLFTKRKAPHREVEIPETLFRYILMCRAEIVREFYRPNEKKDRAQYWKNWLENRGEFHSIGYEVSKRMKTLYDRDVEDVRRTNRSLEKDIETLREIRQFCEKNDINIKSYTWRNRLQELIQGLSEREKRIVREANDVIGLLASRLETDAA